jgi:imidazoleglycerol-phosphate dehydratase/histidinol-phosphatase
MRRILFIDRDGVILQEPDNFQVDHIDKTNFVPGVV